MDRQYIDREHIVERYLSGDLTVREAREFEKYCLEHPDVLQEMPIPVRLKARLSRHPADHSETGMFPAIPSSATIAASDLADEGYDTADDEPTKLRHGRGTSKGLLFGLLAALVLVATALVIYGLKASRLETELQTIKQAQRATALQAPSGVQNFAVKMNRAGIPADPTIALVWPDPAQLLDIRIDTSELRYTQYQVTIEKRGEARLIIMRRLARDSNRELRFAMNSSAFGPGEYIVKVEGYTWRGQLEDVGWLKVALR